jgi:hypothetical protein
LTMDIGGLNTNFHAIKANLFLSVLVAITGISIPIALSFVLQSLVNATPLQAFAAGAALCSTSLGVVLSSAAMTDDVVGLVMVQVISNLGGAAEGFDVVTVVRPLAVSVGLAVAVPLVCQFVVLPLTVFLNGARKAKPNGVVGKVSKGTHTAFIVHTLILLGLVTGASYAGTSNLFSSYLAGAAVSWWDSEIGQSGAAVENSLPELTEQSKSVSGTELMRSPARREEGSSGPETEETESEAVRNEHREPTASSGIAVYEKYYATAVQHILKPFFFVSRQSLLYPHADKIKGINRLCHPNHRYVQRRNCLARHRLHNPHALRETHHRRMAHPPEHLLAKSPDSQERAFYCYGTSFVLGLGVREAS